MKAIKFPKEGKHGDSFITEIDGSEVTFVYRGGWKREVEKATVKGQVGPEGQVGPKGDKGDAGPKGDKGDAGPKGDSQPSQQGIMVLTKRFISNQVIKANTAVSLNGKGQVIAAINQAKPIGIITSDAQNGIEVEVTIFGIVKLKNQPLEAVIGKTLYTNVRGKLVTEQNGFCVGQVLPNNELFINIHKA